MALIDTTVLLGIADRAAFQYKTIDDAIDAINVEGGGFYFDRVTATNDPDVEIPLIVSYEVMDTTVTTRNVIRRGLRELINIVNDMNGHFNRPDGSGNPLQTGSWDGYLIDADKRVSDFFNLLHEASTGRFMLAINVFSEEDDTLATAEVTTGPTLTFTDGINYGNGADTNKATGGNFSASQLRAVAEVTIGGTDLDLRLTVKDIDDQLDTIDITIPASTASGTSIDIGTGSDRFLDVTNVVFKPAGSTGTVSDKVTIRNKKERIIAL